MSGVTITLLKYPFNSAFLQIYKIFNTIFFSGDVGKGGGVLLLFFKVSFVFVVGLFCCCLLGVVGFLFVVVLGKYSDYTT